MLLHGLFVTWEQWAYLLHRSKDSSSSNTSWSMVCGPSNVFLETKQTWKLTCVWVNIFVPNQAHTHAWYQFDLRGGIEVLRMGVFTYCSEQRRFRGRQPLHDDATNVPKAVVPSNSWNPHRHKTILNPPPPPSQFTQYNNLICLKKV